MRLVKSYTWGEDFMKKLIRKLSVAVLATSMCLSGTACSGNSKTGGGSTDPKETPKSSEAAEAIKTDEKVELNVWHLWTTETDASKIAYDSAVKEYMDSHSNVTITTHSLENDAYKTKISTEFAGGAKNIDIFFWWGGGRGKKFAQADKLLAIEDYVSDAVKAKIKPGTTQAFTYDNKLYALPTYSWYMTLYCNTELFEKAGAKVPSTYDEFVDACKKLKDSGVTPLAIGAKEGWNAAFMYEALAMREVGAENVNKVLDGQANFDDPGFKEAANKVLALTKMGAFGKNPLELSSPDADSLYYTGKAGMRLMGNWLTQGIYDDKSSIVQDKTVAVKIPMLAGKAKDSDYCGGFVDAMFINKNTMNKEVAVDFTAFLSERLAKARYESGQGFSAWDVPMDGSGLKPIATQVAALAGSSIDGVLAWDTSLDENRATTHLEAVQGLFTENGNVDDFMSVHQEILSNK